MIAYLTARQQQGDKLILWTNRTGERLSEAVTWCANQGIMFDAINENLAEIVERFGGDCRKVYADQYIEDKAVLPDALERTYRIRRRW